MPSYKYKSSLPAWGLYDPETGDLLATCRAKIKEVAIWQLASLEPELRGGVVPDDKTVRAVH